MESRIPASERTSQKLNDLLTEGVADGDALAELLKLAVRRIVEQALEAEVSEALGRGYYESGADPGRGYRNGYRRGRLRTAEGAIDYGVPEVSDRVEPFVSRVRAGLADRTAELERLAVEMFARGLSTRDIEAAFTQIFPQERSRPPMMRPKPRRRITPHPMNLRYETRAQTIMRLLLLGWTTEQIGRKLHGGYGAC